MIKIHPSKNGQFYFTVNARNGQPIVTSETYKRKRSCVFGIAALIRALKAGPEIKIIDLVDRKKKV